MAAVLDGSEPNHLPPGLAHAWGLATTTAPRRGPKPAHTVDQIVEAAIELADAEDFAALSMPRIGRQLGFTANALYRYVSSKDELLVLIGDAAWGAPPDMARAGEHWRDAAAGWVHAVIDRYRQRPWLLDIPIRGAPVTPNLLRWLEVLLSALSGSGLDQQDTLGCAMLLDSYARSTASLIRGLAGNEASPAQASAVMEFLHPLLRDRGYPLLADLLASGAYQDGDDLDKEVEFGLDRILDGIDALVAARQGAALGS